MSSAMTAYLRQSLNLYLSFLPLLNECAIQSSPEKQNLKPIIYHSLNYSLCLPCMYVYPCAYMYVCVHVCYACVCVCMCICS